MSLSVHRSDSSRHLIFRASSGDTLPDALATALRDEQVSCGWLRASGVLVDVELRAFDAELGTLGSTRRIAGPVQVLTLEGSIGLVDGEPSFSLRAVLARETDRGLETMAGEIASARTVALEVLVTTFDDLNLERTLDESAGVWLLGARSPLPVAARPARVRAPAPAAAPMAWTSALEASERAVEREPQRARPTATFTSMASAPMPQRPARVSAASEQDGPFPEPGDAVDHFAFGRADVVKSDGDRLHVKVHKDGRIKEIALEMLRVSRLPDAEDGRRRFKLERRM